MKEKHIEASFRAIFLFILAFVLILFSIFALSPAASATSPEKPSVSTAQLKKGSLFLKANVPEDFYDVVCVTLKDKSTEREMTLKVEGGSVFEVYIQLPDGEYDVVSAYVEKDDRYTVSFDKTEITAGADLSPSILLDVQLKPDEEEESAVLDPTTSDEPSDETAQTVSTDEPTPSETNNSDVSNSEEPAPSATDLSEHGEESDAESSSNSTKETIWDICLSILVTVVFFFLIAFIVYFVRTKMAKN